MSISSLRIAHTITFVALMPAIAIFPTSATARYFRFAESSNRDGNATAALDAIQSDLFAAGKHLAEAIRLEATVPKAFWLNLFDALGGGAKAAQRSQILEELGFAAFNASSNMFFPEPDLTLNFHMQQIAPAKAERTVAIFSPLAEAILEWVDAKMSIGCSRETIFAELGVKLPYEFVYEFAPRNHALPELAGVLGRCCPGSEEQLLNITYSSSLDERRKRVILAEIIYRGAGQLVDSHIAASEAARKRKRILGE